MEVGFWEEKSFHLSSVDLIGGSKLDFRLQQCCKFLPTEMIALSATPFQARIFACKQYYLDCLDVNTDSDDAGKQRRHVQDKGIFCDIYNNVLRFQR